MTVTKKSINLLSKRCVLIISAAIVSLSASAAQSQWVYPGPDGKLVYKTTPAGDRIMDFSSAGYMGGGVALPNVPIKRTVAPSGKADDSAVIQAAINEVAAMPLQGDFRGAVLLAPGTFNCSNTIYISTNGIVLRGSGSGTAGSTIQMYGARHTAIVSGPRRERRAYRAPIDEEDLPAQGHSSGVGQTVISDGYVPSGSITFDVLNPGGFAPGDTIEIRRPITAAWVRFMGMDDLVRYSKRETWLRIGEVIPIERCIAAVSGNKMTLDVPLSDSFDSKYLNPPGVSIVKIQPLARLTQIGIEHLHIQSPPQAVNHTQALYSAVRLNGQDCWMRDVIIDETMNSVGLGGRRITVENVTVNRKALHQGSSKPAEFAPNGDQILLNHCAVNADNVWFAATGTGHSGPIVFLNCAFSGDGHIEGHMRWTTGMLLDNCSLPGGGIDFKNRGEMGSGHGWGMAWAVAWNCVANAFVVQRPPGAYNWAIGCIGHRELLPRPFDSKPLLPEGTFDSHGQPVIPQSLYLAQLQERLGLQALVNLGYSRAELAR